MNNYISLVLPVVDRYDAVFNFLDFIRLQTYKHYEVIIVDQGYGIDIKRLENYNDLSIDYNSVDFKSSSLARNFGIVKSNGNIIGFPDDDCVYQSKDLLELVSNYFNQYKKEDCVVLDRIDHFENDLPIVPDILSGKISNVNKQNFLHLVTGWNFLVRKEKIISLFDSKLGISETTLYGAGEDVDFVISNFGFNLRKLDGVYISHPTLKHNSNSINERTFKYAIGLGAILKKHYGLKSVVKQTIRSCLGAMLSLLKLDFLSFKRYLIIVSGVVSGYILWKK